MESPPFLCASGEEIDSLYEELIHLEGPPRVRIGGPRGRGSGFRLIDGLQARGFGFLARSGNLER